MDDREIVAAIATGDPGGLVDGYDKYAASLYGYCRWRLGEPEDAANAVQDTFVIATARLGGLRDPRKLWPWLYAVARNECHHRLRPAEAYPDEAVQARAYPDEATHLADPPADPLADVGARPEQAELRRLVRVALDGLDPGEREVLELGLRHDLHGADLAAVLGMPRNQAHALVSRAYGQLEKALGALIVALTGRRACPELDMLLDGWDGRLTGVVRKRVSRHVDQCEACADRRHGALQTAALYGMDPLAAPPPWLREEVLGLCADSSPRAQSYRREVTERAGSFLPNGFPQAVRASRPRMLALAGVAAVVGILVAIAATGVITVLALSGPHHPQSAHAAGPSTVGAAATGPAGGAESPSLSPVTSAAAVTSAPPPAAPPLTAPPPAAAPSASPTKVKPSASPSPTSPAAPTPTPPSQSPPSQSPPSQSPPTPTPTPTATPTDTPTPTPTFSRS